MLLIFIGLHYESTLMTTERHLINGLNMGLRCRHSSYINDLLRTRIFRVPRLYELSVTPLSGKTVDTPSIEWKI